MSPRPYRLDRRQAAAEETRARIITAARELLSAGDGVAGFSIDAVAREAGVARMTVYYQFSSKRGLYEALADNLATRAEIGERLRVAFRQEDALDALDAFIAAFGHFWTPDRVLIRRLHGVAATDPEIGRGELERNERRRSGLRVVLERVAAQYGRPESFDEAVDVLHTLTSFETFDSLAGTTRSPEEVVAVVQRLARAVLGLPNR
ncbi:MAG TPA: TetR/AcrR family transcriptional regulator [Thermomicrobiales bacterium]|jgi:AcrR family transcriptional regulator|nr:TetR/AcrR family transcriptional regulator [Thermomicrobiales bacterium]